MVRSDVARGKVTLVELSMCSCEAEHRKDTVFCTVNAGYLSSLGRGGQPHQPLRDGRLAEKAGAYPKELCRQWALLVAEQRASGGWQPPAAPRPDPKAI